MAADAAPRAAAAVADDYCGGRCSDILPPGGNGNATLAQILLNQAFGTQPGHAEDQLGPYADLAKGYPALTWFRRGCPGVHAGQESPPAVATRSVAASARCRARSTRTTAWRNRRMRTTAQ